MKNYLNHFVMCLLLLIVGCSKERNVEPREVVLSSAFKSIQSPIDDLEIIYVDKTTRKIKYGKDEYIKNMIVRKERFVYEGQIGSGILGIYNPGEMYGNDTSERVVYMENEVKFIDVNEVKRYLYQGSAVYKRVFMGNGIIMSYNISQFGLNIEIKRLLIGERYIDEYFDFTPGKIIIAQQGVAPEPVTHQ